MMEKLMTSIAGRRVLITGSGESSAATARAFASAGAAVALAGADDLALIRTARAVELAGGRALVLPGDVAERRALTMIVDAAGEALGGLDAAVNVVESCRAAYLAIRSELPLLVAGGGGTIVNAIGVVLGRRPEEADCVVGLTRAAAVDHAGDRVRVNALVPGGGFGTAADFASTALWLCSDAAAHVSGAAVPLGLRPVAA
jgi:NAD(P)-dependent dehydrogenase (short-subunit alcohol dehydrogenase family)